MIAFDYWWNGTRKTPADNSSHPSSRPRITPEDVFHTYAGRVYNLARRLLVNEADAEDVTQEVLLQVVRKLDTFRGEADLATWLHRVTTNAVLAHRRTKASRPEFQTFAPLEGLAAGDNTNADRPDASAPEEQMIRRETQQLLEKAIAKLPFLYRDVLVLSDVEQLTNPEIADLLGISLPAVKSRLHRARQLMRHNLGPHFGRPGDAELPSSVSGPRRLRFR